MHSDRLRQRRLTLLLLVFVPLTVVAFLAWLVNLEMALRVLVPEWRMFESLFPSGLFAFFHRFAADLSTISTLVVVLLFAFPVGMGGFVLRQAKVDPGRLSRLVHDPYPPHFPFFLVMLGLCGTLYGLLIGLNVSGVSELGMTVSSPETIQQTLDQLLDGTATALLSSLMGLLGAFLAARPLTWLFHWAAVLPGEDERGGLSETLRGVVRDLHAMGEASRSFTSRLEETRIEDVPAMLGEIREGLSRLGDGIGRLNEGVDSLGKVQTAGLGLQERFIELQQELVEEQRRASRQGEAERQTLIRLLNGMEEGLRSLHEATTKGNDLLQGLGDTQRGQLEVAERVLREAGEHHRSAQGQRETMIGLLSDDAKAREEDRAGLRKAFAGFIAGKGTAPAAGDSRTGKGDEESS